MNNALSMAFPRIGASLRHAAIASVPTPVTSHTIGLPPGTRNIMVKHDEATNDVYGGNKVRKLEYLLRRAGDRTVTVRPVVSQRLARSAPTTHWQQPFTLPVSVSIAPVFFLTRK
jgi:hypothetical protein